MPESTPFARLIKTQTSSTGADQKVYEVTPPMKYDDWEDGEMVEKETRYIVVSAVAALLTGPETYIFPCDKNGKVTSWGELEGSYRGALDHNQALSIAGYKKVVLP